MKKVKKLVLLSSIALSTPLFSAKLFIKNNNQAKAFNIQVNEKCPSPALFVQSNSSEELECEGNINTIKVWNEKMKKHVNFNLSNLNGYEGDIEVKFGSYIISVYKKIPSELEIIREKNLP